MIKRKCFNNFYLSDTGDAALGTPTPSTTEELSSSLAGTIATTTGSIPSSARLFNYLIILVRVVMRLVIVVR